MNEARETGMNAPNFRSLRLLGQVQQVVGKLTIAIGAGGVGK